MVFDKTLNRGRGFQIDKHRIKISKDGPRFEESIFMKRFFLSWILEESLA